ncbi:T9SS type B sorting domain-containing protein [uncultured Polaribacter sp.]|uniref:T9SS type B sorting domain-containing protein n=2 Tax=Polaribacter TaxID=52959 RepID=UPI00261E95A9|nr:T9SS type B sorting domain-containing protein [uncultured Polaribacter sp.]
MQNLKPSFFLVLFFFIGVTTINAQLSKKHFIPPLTYAETGNANPENQYFYISTPSSNNVSFTIKQIGFPNNNITGFVSKSNPQEIFIESGDSQLFVSSPQTSVIHNNKGYIIEADDVIYVSVRVLAGGGAQAGALVSKGSAALGTIFRAGMYTNENPQSNYLNFISVMASEDNTQVTFSDLPTGIAVKNYSGTLPISITLNEGESYIVATNAADNTINKDGLIGTLINSDKPIVVNLGSANGSFHNGGGRDYGIDQIVGLDKIGTEYIFVKGDGENGWENVLIVAHEDDTEIRVNGNSNFFAKIPAGGYALIEGNQFNNGNLFVQTTKPVFAYQGVGASNSEANQGMFFVPPLSCESRGKVDNIPFIENIGNVTFTGGVTVVTNANATVTINSEPIANFSTSGPFEIDINNDGISDYETYKVTNLTGAISVESSEELYCAYFNVNGAATSGSFYSGFPSNPEINFDASVTALGNCIPNVTLQAANTDAFDRFEWQFFDESMNTWVQKSTNSNYSPVISEPGRYRLIGTIDCTGATFNSVEIPVSLCPDDYDNDLIIDNLDLDLDNDGILNVIESFGDGILNFSDIDNPSINTNSKVINNFFTTELTKSGNVDFVGNPNGNFTSTINENSTSNASIFYILNSTETFNFEFTQNQAITHFRIDGEEFEISIAPSAKNITLIDPDNILMVDTNFDGEFETGVTNFSSSLIRFKYNPNPNGTIPFKFVANDVEKFLFLHTATSNVLNSIFNASLKLTSVKRDSDGDGIEDALDLDSDNDGVPDLFEAANQKINLTNTDANLDGLDDIFDSFTLIMDTDGDGVPNYLDLDSDNDGIYDSTESSHNLDTNVDGLIDGFTDTNSNGITDNLENDISVTTLSVNYSIADTDSDGIFNFLELDSDNDACFDVIEAGFTGNGSGILFANPFVVDSNGLVINNTNGYTTPSINYTTSAAIVINSFTNVTFCENSTSMITIDTTADGFQWEFSTDNGTNWSPISNNAIYNGVNTKDLQITNIPLSFNNNLYRVLLTKVGNSCEKISNAITAKINPVPVVVAEVDLLQCDDDLDRISSVNLTEAEISISSNSTNETFQYFENEANAKAGTPLVADEIRFPVNQTGEAWVRTISSEGCFTISKINIEVEAAADVAYNKEFPSVCDDFLQEDGTNGTLNDDTDGITNFDFSIANTEILAFFPITLRPDLEVSYYETTADRTAVINAIGNISNYRNIGYPSNNTRQTIYFKITNKNNNNCSGTGELYLKTDSTPTANPVTDLELCDDVTDGDAENGIIQNFDLEAQTATILGSQNPADFSVTYHLSAAEANSGSNPQASPFANTVRDIQPIFVRVTNNNTGCFTDHTSFNLIVNPIPVANFVADLEICDDNSDGSARNGFSQSIDLDSQTSGILGIQDQSINAVTYHRSFADAQSGNNPLVSPYSNETPNRETIYIRIENTDTGCVNSISNFDVIVNPEPTFTPVSNLSYCDDDLDGDDTNGIIQNIDLDSQIPALLGSQDPDDFNVTFHANDIDAATGFAPIASPYTNSNPTETIFVRIQNKRTLCVNDDASFQLIVNPLPDFMVTSPQIICLNDTPLTIGVENPAGVYTYQWKDSSGTIISFAETADVTVGGNYTVTATTTNGTNCTRSETIVVNESNPATLLSSFVTIVDEGNIIGSNANLSISIDTINNDLGPGDYQFALKNDDENTTTPFQNEPLFENLEGSIYTIIVNDKNGCVPDATLQVSVIQFPKFFTPNGDGKNDTWAVKGANKTFYPNASINIFNRYGKLVAQIPIDSQGWNGTYNGKLLTSDDYWYNITLIPADKTKPTINKKGNFSLVRR